MREDLPDQTRLIHERPWDTLIILDACRFAAFEARYEKYLEGDLTKVRSPASCTRDWLRRTWTEEYPDITYISSNNFMMSKISVQPNQYPHIHNFEAIIDVWMVGTTADLINDCARKIPGRKVLHYDQPPLPNEGAIKTGGWEGYNSNLDYVLEYVAEILHELGKTIITSDHGELLLRRQNHPCNKDYPELVDVPWLENSRVKQAPQ